MEELIAQFKDFVEQDLKDMPNEDKITFYTNCLQDLDVLMGTKGLDLDAYEQFLEIKKSLMTKIYLLKD